jgi:uncharacterized coiled-coil DUF342 family protein
MPDDNLPTIHPVVDPRDNEPVIRRAFNEFKQEMYVFRNEFNEFKQEMYKFKHEMYGFKQEMYQFQQEMYEFRQEMYEFKQEMYEFRREMYEFRQEMYEFRGAVVELFDRQRIEFERYVGAITESLRSEIRMLAEGLKMQIEESARRWDEQNRKNNEFTTQINTLKLRGKVV